MKARFVAVIENNWVFICHRNIGPTSRFALQTRYGREKTAAMPDRKVQMDVY